MKFVALVAAAFAVSIQPLSAAPKELTFAATVTFSPGTPGFPPPPSLSLAQGLRSAALNECQHEACVLLSSSPIHSPLLCARSAIVSPCQVSIT